MISIGIMQGRLSVPPAGRPQAFPWTTWREEFSRASACGFQRLEWLLTADRLLENPLWSDAGLAEIRALASATGVRVASLCADCFIAHPFVRVSEAERANAVDLLARLVDRSAAAGIEVVALPIIESGSLRDRDEATEFLQVIRPVLVDASRLGVRIGLESDIAGSVLRELIDAQGTPALGAYCDVGNAAAMGADPAADIRALGPRIVGVHVKDRRRGGVSVPLGEGDVNFAECVDALAVAGYGGSLILETPAGSDPQESSRRHLTFVQRLLPARAGPAHR